MNSSGDAAESIVRMSLQGIEVAARISGVGAKNIAVLLYTIMKDKQQTKGKTKLTNMLKSGKELKVFSIKEENLKKFTEEAKRYGVLFSALINKKQKTIDGMVDIMVRAEDAGKINRIVERFNLSTVDTVTIKSEIQKAKLDKNEKNKEVIVKSVEEQLVNDILIKTVNEDKDLINPNVAKTEKNPLLEPTLNNKNKADQGAKSKNSVKEEIKKIKNEQKLDSEKSSRLKTNNIHNKHELQKKKIKERGN